MILNTKQFWTWWTAELREWFGSRFNTTNDKIDLTKNETLSIKNKIGSASAGKPSTLFGAIENVKVDTSGLATSEQAQTIINNLNTEAGDAEVDAMFAPLPSKTITTNGIHDVNGYGTAIVNVPGGGGEPVLQPLNVTHNGTYTPQSGVDGYSQVSVNVPQGTFDLGELFDEAYLNHQNAIDNQDISKLGASALVLPFNAGVFPNNLQGAFIGREIVYVDDIYNITTLYEAFSGCYLLKHIGLLHASQATSVENAFAGCEALVDIDGIDGLGTSFAGGEELKLNDCINLSVQSFINIAKTIAQITVTSYIQVNSEQYDAISVETIEVEGETFTIEDYITNKGWTIEVI